MATKVFVSSTYLDLEPVRDAVELYLQEQKFDPLMFEKGGVYFDPSMPVDESCYEAVKESDIFVLIIGRRYGSPATGETKTGKKFNSVTKKEYQTAKSQKIPIFIFVKSQVLSEYFTYKKNKDLGKEMAVHHADSPLIHELIESIYDEDCGNYIKPYESQNQIISTLRSQFSGMIAKAVKESRRASKKPAKRRQSAKQEKIRISPLKLFYHRDRSGVSLTKLARELSVSRSAVQKLEKLQRDTKNPMDTASYPMCDVKMLQRIEAILQTNNLAVSPRGDDHVSSYLAYYEMYKGKPASSSSRRVRPEAAILPVKAVAYDFDGTLTMRENDHTTWEHLWEQVGLTVAECDRHHLRYNDGEITHKQWCDITLERFQDAGICPDDILRVAESIKLLDGVREVIELLSSNNIKQYIISGSIKSIVKEVVGDLWDHFDDVRANDLEFSPDGVLSGIVGTKYDFEGKADYLLRIRDELDVHPLEILYVGNSYNDSWAAQSGVSTLLVNPHFESLRDLDRWIFVIKRMSNFQEILRYTGRFELIPDT